MRTAIFCLIIFTTFLNFSCQRNVEGSPISMNEKPVETPQPSATPTDYRSIEDKEPTSIEYAGFKIEKVAVKKTDGENQLADIFDVVISKNGKAIRRFDGDYNPNGNFVRIELEQLLNGSEKQLIISDMAWRQYHSRIVAFSPRLEVLFDEADFDNLYGGLETIDVDNDGEKEIALTTISNVYYGFSWVDEPRVRIIFKYDAKTRKYQPASHLFPDITLKEQDIQVRNADGRNKTNFPDVLETTLAYIYAGKETEGWRFFDENLPEPFSHNGMELKKETARARITAALNKDPIYKFIKADLKKSAP